MAGELEAGETGLSDLDDQPAAPRVRRLSALGLVWRLCVLCAGIRVGLEVIGLVSLTYHDQPPWTHALDLWNRWDATHYLRLAEVGYVRSSPPPNQDDPLSIVFYPFFPLAVYFVSLVAQDLLVSALVVSFAACVGAGYFLFRLVALDADEATAWRAVWLLFSFPTAYFLSAPFTEALFLFAVLASVYAARTGRWARAGVAGALATGTRVTGVALAPALLVEVFARKAGMRERIRHLLWISFAAVGLLFYLVINKVVHGNPLYFLEVERAHWFHEMVPPWEPVKEAIDALWGGGQDFIFAFIFAGRLAGVLVGVPLLVLAIRRLRWADVLYGWTAIVLMLSASWLISFPRYLVVLYPLFVVAARLSRSRWVFVPFLVAGAALQGWLMWQYASGQWTF